MYDVMMQLPSP